jgi:NAD(P)-dependent dehydrogenase (short-subunit alcohol dehydrogenase family)
LLGEAAVVTGATSGLGRTIGVMLAAEGAAVAVVGRDRARGQAVVDEIASAGGHAIFVRADLGTEAGCADAVAEAGVALGSITVLVNSAYNSDAIRYDAPVASLDAEVWTAMVAGGLSSVVFMCKHAIPFMRRAGRGSIVNISARCAERGTPGMASHAMTKGAINALTRSIAVDYAAEGIRANAVMPGHVLHEARDARVSPERRAALEAMHLTRLATAEDIAHGVVYLASRESEIVTGTILPLDGGSTAARASTLGGADPRRVD